MTEPQRTSRTRFGIGRLFQFRPIQGGMARFLRRVAGLFRLESKDNPKNLDVRIVIFGIVLVAAYLWLLLNQGFTHLQICISALAAVLALEMRVLNSAILKENLKQKLFFMLRTPMLLTTTALFVFASFFWSSVQVSAGGVEDRTNLKLGVIPADLTDVENLGSLRATHRALYNEKEAVRFRTSTLPWGRPYVISVEGCPPYSFTLWPWKANSLLVNEVLDGCPSLLLRIPAELHSVLAGGKVRVHSGSQVIAETLTESDRGAILLGRNIPVPGEFGDFWKTELEARGMTGQNAARSLYNWHHPIHVVPQRVLRPQMRLSIEFETQAGVVLASRKELVVGKRRIEDVPLLCVQ